MSKNYIPEIAEMLGVEVGEEFRILGQEGDFKFSREELLCYSSNTNCCESVLIGLIRGKLTIKRHPFKPIYGETYYFIDTFGDIYDETWYDNSENIAYYLMGNCFRSKKVAETHMDEIAKKYKETFDELGK